MTASPIPPRVLVDREAAAREVERVGGTEWKSTNVIAACVRALPAMPAKSAVQDVETAIAFCSTRPQPGTPTGDAWEAGARWAWSRFTTPAGPAMQELPVPPFSPCELCKSPEQCEQDGCPHIGIAVAGEGRGRMKHE